MSAKKKPKQLPQPSISDEGHLTTSKTYPLLSKQKLEKLLNRADANEAFTIELSSADVQSMVAELFCHRREWAALQDFIDTIKQESIGRFIAADLEERFKRVLNIKFARDSKLERVREALFQLTVAIREEVENRFVGSDLEDALTDADAAYRET